MNININTHCGRCGGSGRLARFVRVNGGDCFACNGTGVDAAKAAALREAVEAEVAAERAAEERAIEAQRAAAATPEAQAAARELYKKTTGADHITGSFDPLAIICGIND